MATASPEPEGGDRESFWNYLAYRVLSRLDEEQHDWRSVTSGQFSKLPCIADRYLHDELGRDIDFPRYWYKYGEVGNRDPLDNSLFIVEEADWGGLEVRPTKSAPDFDIDEDVREDIDESVEFVVRNFANVKIERVKDLQYKHFAPNDFIRMFDAFREEIYELAEEIEDSDTLEDESKREHLIDSLKDVVSAYPSAVYEKMESDFRNWATIMWVLLDSGVTGEAEAQLEEFWSVFSKVHLRIEHNNNRIDEQIERWEHENEFELQKYRDQVQKTKERVFTEMVDSQEQTEEGITAEINDLME